MNSIHNQQQNKAQQGQSYASNAVRIDAKQCDLQYEKAFQLNGYHVASFVKTLSRTLKCAFSRTVGQQALLLVSGQHDSPCKYGFKRRIYTFTAVAIIRCTRSIVAAIDHRLWDRSHIGLAFSQLPCSCVANASVPRNAVEQRVQLRQCRLVGIVFFTYVGAIV